MYSTCSYGIHRKHLIDDSINIWYYHKIVSFLGYPSWVKDLKLVINLEVCNQMFYDKFLTNIKEILIQIKMNPVSDYLEENKGTKFSVKLLSKRLDIKKRAVYYYIFQNKNIRRVNPIEVGNGAKSLRIFTID
jgi:hypothetical protein